MEEEQSDGGRDFPPKKSISDTAVQQQSQPQIPTATDLQPQKRLARQLDFTGYSSGSLPEHPNQNQTSAVVLNTSQPQPQPQVQPPQQQQQQQPPLPPQPPKPQSPIMLMPVQSSPVPPPVLPAMRKPESPRPRPRQTASESKDGTPKKQKQCNCKHSRCLKLYCECFASGVYCDGCNCVNCHNNVENEAARREAVEATLERNPNAFRPKIASSPHGARDNREETGEGVVLAKHNKGCHCKKSGCLKKYCECFQANILCSDNCKCLDCKNYEGSEERQALFHVDHANNMAYIQQAANAAITGAIGSSGFGSPPVNKKRKGQELFFGGTGKDPLHRLGQFQQANHVKTSVPSSSLSVIPGARMGNPAGIGPSKFTYRSLLADIIQPEDLKELCSVLVVYSAEAAKMLADERRGTEKPIEEQRETPVALTQAQPQGNNDSVDVLTGSANDDKNGNPAEKDGNEESSSDCADVLKGRPMSPGTLALMCDEQDTMFTTTSCSNDLIGQDNLSSQLPEGQGISEAYAEQERFVLTKFRDCLQKLIFRGDVKEKEFSSLARTESDNQRDISCNGSTGIRIQTKNQQEPMSNGLTKLVVPPSIRTSSEMVSAAMDPAPKIPSPSENGDVKT